MKIQAENNEEEEDRDTTPTPQVDDEEDKANNLLDISEIKNPPEAQPVEEFRSLEKLGKILTPVQKLKNAEKINGTPKHIEKIKLEKPTTPAKNEEDGEQARDQEVVETIKKHLFDSPCNPTVKAEEDIEKADEKPLENLINISVKQPKIKEEEEN